MRIGNVAYFSSERPGEAVWVTDFGATGDGVTDDLQSIEAAIAHAETTGVRRVYFPAGTYAISESILVPERFEILGAGKWVVTIRPHGDFPLERQALVRSKEPTGTDYITIRGIGVDRENYGTEPYSKGIYLSRTRHSRIIDCRVVNCKSYGIYVESTSQMETGTSVPKRISYDVIISDCYVENCEEQIEVRSAQKVIVTRNTVVNVPGRTINGILFYLDEAQGIISENVVIGEGGNGINLTQTARGCVVANNHVELLNPHVSCLLTDTADHVVVGGRYVRRGQGGSGGGSVVRFQGSANNCILDGVCIYNENHSSQTSSIYIGSSTSQITIRGCSVTMADVPSNTVVRGVSIEGSYHTVAENRINILGEPTLSQVTAIHVGGRGSIVSQNQITGGRIFISGLSVGSTVRGNVLNQGRIELSSASTKNVVDGNMLHNSTIIGSGTDNVVENNIVVST